MSVTLTGNGTLAQTTGLCSAGMITRATANGILAGGMGAIVLGSRTGTPKSISGLSLTGATTFSGIKVFRKREVRGQLVGLTTFTPYVARVRKIVGLILSGVTTTQAFLARKRPVSSSISGQTTFSIDFHVDLFFPTVFHVPVNESEILLTAVIRGWHTIESTFFWELKTVAGSGYERLLSPYAKSTRLENLVPYGHYVLECTIVNGEGRKRSNRYTVLVDAA